MGEFKALAVLMDGVRSAIERSQVFSSNDPLVCFVNQENVASYPCVIINLVSFLPLPRPVPTFKFCFSLHLLSREYDFALKSVDVLLLELDSDFTMLHFDANAAPSLIEMTHVGTSWDYGQDTFSIRAKVSYEGNMVFEQGR